MVDAAKIPLYGVILAGGSGTRFWPLSRSQYPKQVLRLLGPESMLQTTVERLLPRIPAPRQAVVTNAGQAELIHQELHRKGWDEVRIWIEPEGKNTAAAVGLAAVYLGDEAEDAVMAVFPAAFGQAAFAVFVKQTFGFQARLQAETHLLERPAELPNFILPTLFHWMIQLSGGDAIGFQRQLL